MTAAIARAGHALELVRTHLENAGAAIRPRGADAFLATCPLHEDRSPSLSVRWKTGRPGDTGGAVFLKCFSCNASADFITAAIGLKVADLFDNPLPERPAAPRRPFVSRAPRPAPRTAPTARDPQPQTHTWQKVRVYTYTDSAGWPVQQVIRHECHCDGTRHKKFVQRYRRGRAWIWDKPEGFTPVLYRAPQLAAADRRDWVWLVEGEKDADTAERLGRIATTNAQGALSFPDELAHQLAGRNIAIVVDRDTAGYQRAVALHAQLAPHATDIAILLPAVTDAKADLTDHVSAGRWIGHRTFGGLIPVSLEQIRALLTGPNTD